MEFDNIQRKMGWYYDHTGENHEQNNKMNIALSMGLSPWIRFDFEEFLQGLQNRSDN